MGLTTTKKISLDFYNNNIVTINAKQYDTKSRYLNISCTEYGKKVVLDASSMSAFVRYNKADNTYVFNDETIESDGTVTVELTQQMLAATGKCTVDVIIVGNPGIKVENLSNMDDIYKLTPVISTMSFYLNVLPTAVDHSTVESSNEYNALLKGISQMIYIEEHMEELDQTLNNNEAIRQAAENTRISNETTRQSNEATRQSNETTRINNESARVTAEKNRVAAENARVAAENSRVEAETSRVEESAAAVSAANEAAANANEKAELCQGVIDKTGVVLKTDIANNLTTTDADKVLDARQGKTLNDSKVSKSGDTMTGTLVFNNANTASAYQKYRIIDEVTYKQYVGIGVSNNSGSCYQEIYDGDDNLLARLDVALKGLIYKTSDTTINITDKIATLEAMIEALPQYYYGTSNPSSSTGKDGDIYMQIIEVGE